MNDRTCIVTRQHSSADELLRFVADPEGRIVPDLRGNLPGRGAWVSLSRTLLLKAIKNKAFARSLRSDITVDESLVDLVDALLVKSALGALSMARKAGAVVTGSTKVDSAIRSHQVRLVLHAVDAAEDGKRKIAQAIHASQQTVKKNSAKQGNNQPVLQAKNNVEVKSLFTSEEMHVAFGGNHVVHAALLNVQASEGFIKTLRKLQTYREILCNEAEKMTVGAVKDWE